MSGIGVFPQDTAGIERFSQDTSTPGLAHHSTSSALSPQAAGAPAQVDSKPKAERAAPTLQGAALLLRVTLRGGSVSAPLSPHHP